MKFKPLMSFILLFAWLANMCALPLQAQEKPQPIQITFGKPNIWSLEQAHYLLSQMRERSLGINAKALTNLDPNTAEGARLNLLRQVFELSGEFRQSAQLPDITGAPSPTPTPLPTPVPFPSPAGNSTSPFANTVTAELFKSPEFLKKLFSDSKLNATTQLDNHIQLQYEIIAKQLTLLRDEVGPDERLVFLELPQSIYASASDTKGKVAQTYWEVKESPKKVYAEYRREKLTEINEIIDKAKEKDARLKGTDAIACKIFRQEQEEAEKNPAPNKPAKKAETPAEKQQERDQKEQEEAQRKLDEKKSNICSLYEGLAEIDENDYDMNIRKAQDLIQRLKQNGAVPNDEIVKKVGEKFLGMDGSKEAKQESVRAVDIIPRQSSLNITDIQETVKSTFLSGAFSWLFGLGLRTNYQRQRDSFEQYLHQEIYASGFGKGSEIFGWTFGPVPGAKRIAPGVRTTYAVLVVPRKAEALEVTARGCYFPRTSRQPLNVMGEAAANAYAYKWRDDNTRDCFDKKQFVIPIPNGGDARGFWLTAIDYTPTTRKGQQVVVSINGENFTSQVGVLVDGVPLQQVVELTQKLSDNALSRERCGAVGICGNYEVIDSNELTASFRMPDDYVGTPEITVIGPGRSVPVNSIKLSIKVNGDIIKKCKKGEEAVPCMLKSSEVPFMFGSRPEGANAKLTLTKLKFFPDNPAIRPTSALLSGTKFSKFDVILINGDSVKSEHLKATEKLLRFSRVFSSIFAETVTVTLKRCVDKDGKPKDYINCDTSDTGKDKEESETGAFAVPSTQFTVTSVVGLSYDDLKEEMFIRVEGTGLDDTELDKVNGAAPAAGSKVIAVSAREILVKITKPESVVKITLKNPKGNEINSVIVRPPVKVIFEPQ